MSANGHLVYFLINLFLELSINVQNQLTKISKFHVNFTNGVIVFQEEMHSHTHALCTRYPQIAGLDVVAQWHGYMVI